MTDVRLLGVSSTITLHDVKGMTEPEQDAFITEVAKDMQNRLRDMVAGRQPAKGTDLVFQVTGPHSDPLQGTIWVHTLAGHFDLDDLPPECEAVRIHRDGVETPRERQVINLASRRTQP